MEKKDGAKCDPGWNDPPLFSYNSQVSQFRSKPRTLLNKRVAFPLQGASPPSSTISAIDPTAPLPSCNVSTLPPPPAVSNQLTRDTPLKVKESTNSEDEFDPVETLQIVMTNFEQILNDMFENKEKDKNDIKRRLDILKNMWIDNKLNKDIQQSLLSLSKALQSNETERADDLQKGLMVDHPTFCSPWISGVRHLIHHKLPEDQPSSCNIDTPNQF